MVKTGLTDWISLEVCVLQKPPGMKEEDEPEEEEEEELGHAETYAEYMPMKCKCVPYAHYPCSFV